MGVSYSGFVLENTKLPHVNLEKISNTLVTNNSCSTRTEESIYEFIVHSRKKEQTRRILDGIESKYNTISLEIVNRDVLATIWNGRSIIEIEPGLFRGSVQYLITAEKDIGTVPSTISAANLSSGLFKRFNNTTLLKNQVNGFYTSAFAPEHVKRPYIIIPSEDHELLSYNSCGLKMENIFISLVNYDDSLRNAGLVQEEIMSQYDYSSYTLIDSTFTSFEWQSDGMTEIEPGLWEGTVDYLVILEK